MSIHIYFHPNESQAVPKVWGYTQDEVLFGKITSKLTLSHKGPGYGANKVQTKKREGYLFLVTMSDVSQIGFITQAWQEITSGITHHENSQDEGQYLELIEAISRIRSQSGYSLSSTVRQRINNFKQGLQKAQSQQGIPPLTQQPQQPPSPPPPAKRLEIILPISNSGLVW